MNIAKTIEIIEGNAHIYTILKNCPYRILKEWSVKSYAKGELIIEQGDHFTHFHIIVQGEADIYMTAENGKKYSQAIYQQGDFIGEIEIFDNVPSVCNVEALTPLTVLRLPTNYFLDWLQVDHYMSHYFNQNLAKYLYELSRKAGIDSLYPLKYRLSSYLLKYTNPEKENQRININKGKISSHLAVTSRSINRILQEWKQKNIIGIESDSIILLNVKALKEEKERSLRE